MPVIASETIHINVKEDKSIEVKFLEDLGHKRCVNISSYTSVDTEKEQLYNIVKKLVGEKVIECDNNLCCISDNYHSFVNKLKDMGDSE